MADGHAVIVRLRARDVVATRASTIHAAGVAAAVDLHQRLRRGDRWRGAIAHRQTREEAAIALRDRRDILRLLLAPFDLEAPDTGVGNVGEMIVGREILCADQVTAIQFRAICLVGEHVVLAATLRARATIGRSLGDHARHVALPAVRDAERAMYERFEAQIRHRGMDCADVVKCVLAGQHHTLDTKPLHDEGARLVVHRHLRGAMDLERRIDALDQPDHADVLHDRRVDAPVDAFTEVRHRVGKFAGLHKDVERQVDACAMLVGQTTGCFQLVERELGTLIACIEALGAQIHRIGTIGHSCADRVEGAGGGKKFRNGARGAGHFRKIATPGATRAPSKSEPSADAGSAARRARPDEAKYERNDERPDGGEPKAVALAQDAEQKHARADQRQRDLHPDDRHAGRDRSRNLRTPARKSSVARDSTFVVTPRLMPCVKSASSSR